MQLVLNTMKKFPLRMPMIILCLSCMAYNLSIVESATVSNPRRLSWFSLSGSPRTKRNYYWYVFPILIPRNKRTSPRREGSSNAPQITSSNASATRSPISTPKNPQKRTPNLVQMPETPPLQSNHTASPTSKAIPQIAPSTSEQKTRTKDGIIENSFIFMTSARCDTKCRTVVQYALLQNPATRLCAVGETLSIGTVHFGFLKCDGNRSSSSESDIDEIETGPRLTITSDTISKTIAPAVSKSNNELISVENNSIVKAQ